MWLKTRLWYRKYKRYLHNEYDDPDIEERFLLGLEQEKTLSSAFSYRDTEEGVRYWGKREERFLRWYYYYGKEIFRCKWFTIQIKL